LPAKNTIFYGADLITAVKSLIGQAPDGVIGEALKTIEKELIPPTDRHLKDRFLDI
jgi:hypothetical protein